MSISRLLHIFKFKQKFNLKVPCFMQFAETECGVTSLAMVLAYHQAYISIDILREKCGASRDGAKAATLINVAKEFGFAAAGYSVELADIIRLKYPLIAFWNFNHYVVIRGADHQHVYINDPASGKVTVSLAEFDKAFTGVVIAVTPLKTTQRAKNKISLGSFAREWVYGLVPEWIFMILAALLCSVIPLLNSALSSVFINYCIIGVNKTWLPWIVLYSGIFVVISVILSSKQKISQFHIGAKSSLEKLCNLMAHALKLPLLYYALRQKSEIINIFSRAESIVSSVFKNLTVVTVNFLMGIVCLLVMIKIDYLLAVKSILLITLFSVIMYIFEKTNFIHEQNNIHAESKFFSYIMSSLRNLETIKASAMENNILSKWFQLFCQRTKTLDYVLVNAAKITAFSQFLTVFSLLIILYWGSLRVTAGYMSLGSLMAYYALHLAFCRNMDAILQAIKEAQNAYASHFRIDDIKNYSPDDRFNLSNNYADKSQTKTWLSCRNLTFYYNKHSKPNLANINLTISHGQHVAFVGNTGSGKSTLAKLLCGLYRAQQGEISLAGNNLQHFTAAEFSHKFAYVAQDVALFTGTLYENITLGCEQPTADKIKEVIQIVCLQELIKKRGLHAAVSEGGQNFSGGEKQRIDIARALLQDTPILILDEATSALDVVTEAELIKNLRNINKTIIYVAHRLSTTKHCDQIIVLNSGEVKAQGKYEALFPHHVLS